MPRALLGLFPKLEAGLKWQSLGEFPTRVETLSPLGLEDAYIKRDDLSSPVYGGNKVRTLEVLFGAAKRQGASRIVATGAYGSNHALATVLHAPRAGLTASAIVFPQPVSLTAQENLRSLVSSDAEIIRIPHWSLLPLAMLRAKRPSAESYVMVPGGAIPLGALGYVSAALELAGQVKQQELPSPKTVIVGVGSTCTSAGLLLGFWIAHRLGLGFTERPILRSVRVTPWPVTAKFRIVGLARRAAELLAQLTGDRKLIPTPSELANGIELDGSQLGRGYGKATRGGLEAIDRFSALEGLSLDTTYSGKAGAGFLSHHLRQPGPSVFWSTKSTAPLPDQNPAKAIPKSLCTWLDRTPPAPR